MTTAFALHSILNKDGEIAPGTIFDAGSDYDDLKRLGAIRDLTDTEWGLHRAFSPSVHGTGALVKDKKKHLKEVQAEILKDVRTEVLAPKADPISEDTKPVTPVADVDNPKLDI
jgi:hypothetical protein